MRQIELVDPKGILERVGNIKVNLEDIYGVALPTDFEELHLTGLYPTEAFLEKETCTRIHENHQRRIWRTDKRALTQMQSFELAVKKSLLSWMSRCELVERNVRLGSSLKDYLFVCNGRECYLEVKSAALRGNSRYALYPDCPTLRGRRHVNELANLASQGGSATMVFIAALSGVEVFRPNQSGDPETPSLLRNAQKADVTIRAISIHYDPETSTVCLGNPDLEVELGNHE